MHTLALPKSLFSSELGPSRHLALSQLAYLIKKKDGSSKTILSLCFLNPCNGLDSNDTSSGDIPLVGRSPTYTGVPAAHSARARYLTWGGNGSTRGLMDGSRLLGS